MDDQVLLRRFVGDGSDDAMRQLIDRYKSLVYSVCHRRIGQRELAEDATQTVFLILCQKAPTLIRRTSLGGWLYTCADSVSKNAIRRELTKAKLVTSLLFINQSPAELPNTETLLLNDALEKLTWNDREAVTLRFFQQQSFAEIGQAMAITEDAARMRVQRALERIRKELSKVGLTADSELLTSLLPPTLQPVPAHLVEALHRLNFAHPVQPPPTVKGAPPLMNPITVIAATSGIAALIGGSFLTSRSNHGSHVPAVSTASGQPRFRPKTFAGLAAPQEARTTLDSLLQTFTGAWTMDTRLEGFGQKAVEDDGAQVKVSYDPEKNQLKIEGKDSDARELLPRYDWDLDRTTGTLNVVPGGVSHFLSSKVRQGTTIVTFSDSTKQTSGTLTVSYNSGKVVFVLSAEAEVDPKTGDQLKKPLSGKSIWTFQRSHSPERSAS